MTREAGATVIELLVASAIMLAASAVAVGLVAATTAHSPRWNEAADLHQRARVAAEAIGRHLALAGADVPVAAVAATFPAIEPRRRSSFLVSTRAITVRHVPEHAAWTTLAADLPPGAATVAIDVHAGCAAGVADCGFIQQLDAVVLDGRGDWHLLIVQPSAPRVLAVSDRVAGRTATFPAGSVLAEVQETSIYFDPASQTVRQEGPGGGVFPLVDSVADLAFEYFDERRQSLPLAALTDGPLCGSGALAYDCDVRRIRTIRASLAIAAADVRVRDLRLAVDVTPRRRAR